MLLPLLAALALADAACAGIADTPRQAAVVAGFQRRSLAAAPAAGQEPPLLPAPVGALSPRGRPLLQAQDSAPASLPTAEQQAGAGGAPQLPLSLDSPIPFYAALLQPALEPYLPPPEAAEERQQALQRLATQLAPAVDAALNETREQLGALLDAVEEQLGAGAGDAGVSPAGAAALMVRMHPITAAHQRPVEAAPSSWDELGGASMLLPHLGARHPVSPLLQGWRPFRPAPTFGLPSARP
jgi:hypothetical protein